MKQRFSLIWCAVMALALGGGLSVLTAVTACNEDEPVDTTPGEPTPTDPDPEVATCDQPGTHYPAADTCNWCDCSADGIETCTERTCAVSNNACEYEGVVHAYAERFAAADNCNECVCAASGLACTQRACATPIADAAILLESLDEPCGPDETLTGNFMLGYVKPTYNEALDYDQASSVYPETLPDTRLTVNVAYDGGYIVCRAPNSGQAAIDLEAKMELITADGAFDEGLAIYLRRGQSIYTDDVSALAVLPSVADLNGSYDSGCGDTGGVMISASFNSDGSASGDLTKVCEWDMALWIGFWEAAAPAAP